jgi:hypothetical protein
MIVNDVFQNCLLLIMERCACVVVLGYCYALDVKPVYQALDSDWLVFCADTLNQVIDLGCLDARWRTDDLERGH